ncbi:hypothetical protein ACW5XW_24465 [Aeromonas piscicola]|uniref:hypothetical protein n=1 Tax=Aeromonas piscicola TaxID=600645 RepID=UPI0012E027B9|nr:hypothetical protein [Aeromonas piscicola]
MANIKQKNKKYVAAVISLPLFIGALTQFGFDQTKGIMVLASDLGLAFVVMCALVMISSILPQDIKHKLVFLRFKNELPACRCHKFIHHDMRIDIDDIKRIWPKLLDNNLDGKIRNSIWYKEIYREVRDSPQVESAHENFLLYRDSTAGIFIATIAVIIYYVLPMIGVELSRSLDYKCILIHLVSLAVVIICAQVAGKRMVNNAIVEAVNLRLATAKVN